MTTTTPEYWTRRTPRRSPINWRRYAAVAAVGLAGFSLVWSGAAVVAFGAVKIGWAMIGVGVVAVLGLSQVEV